MAKEFAVMISDCSDAKQFAVTLFAKQTYLKQINFQLYSILPKIYKIFIKNVDFFNN